MSNHSDSDRLLSFWDTLNTSFQTQLKRYASFVVISSDIRLSWEERTMAWKRFDLFISFPLMLYVLILGPLISCTCCSPLCVNTIVQVSRDLHLVCFFKETQYWFLSICWYFTTHLTNNRYQYTSLLPPTPYCRDYLVSSVLLFCIFFAILASWQIATYFYKKREKKIWKWCIILLVKNMKKKIQLALCTPC